MAESTEDQTTDVQHFDDRMSDSDALMWSIEKDPMLRSTITTVMLLDGQPDIDQLQRVFERASRSIPRLRQRVRSNPLSIAPPRWEVDPNFDLRYHLRSARAIGEGTVRDVLDMAVPISMQGFDRARPLWEATYVDGLKDGGSALILKIHHSITDGVGGVELMLELLDLDPSAPEREIGPAPQVHVMNQAERFIDAFIHESKRGSDALGRVISTGTDTLVSLRHDPVGSFNSASEIVSSALKLLAPESQPMSLITHNRSLSSSFDVLTMPLDVAKKAGRSLGGTINDVFLAGIVSALDRYHGEHGANQQYLRMGMPINVRGAVSNNSGGNEWVPSRFVVELRHSSLPELVSHIRTRALEARDEPANSLVGPLSNLINRLPTTIVTQVFGMMMKGLDFQASNVPGSPLPVFIAGAPVTSVFPFGPLAGAGINITLLSYVNDLNIGVNIDPASISDPDVFMEILRESYDEILALA
ncbi:MAG: DUF1298 domain-containing protein [Microthrixaceae bacterium]|nr:DUF1298 domain-containing protein [Microthrixaceae bacterium]